MAKDLNETSLSKTQSMAYFQIWHKKKYGWNAPKTDIEINQIALRYAGWEGALELVLGYAFPKEGV